MRFLPNEEIKKEGDPIDAIMFIRSGLIDLKLNSSLFEKYVVQRLHPGCSYGATSFLLKEKKRLHKFLVISATCGEYLQLAYKDMKLWLPGEKTAKIFANLKRELIDDGPPLCDFRIYRRKRDLKVMFA